MTASHVVSSVTIGGNREATRRKIVELFLSERPGIGSGDDATRYRYVVDKSLSGYNVEIWRPAQLNKGFDFTIRIPQLKINNKKNPWCHVPSHKDLIELLAGLKNSDVSKYYLVVKSLQNIFECKDEFELNDLKDWHCHPLAPGCGAYPADLIVLISRWLFVEQDVTYWNYSGRNKLWGVLKEAGLS